MQVVVPVAPDLAGDGQSFRINEESYSPEEAQDAFDFFFANLHPHLPFLERLKPTECLAHSAVLFWTILTITSKITDRRRFERLQPLLRSLVSGIVSTGHQGIAECQALCLLCIWPLDGVDGRGGDNIHLYARLAYAIAVERGLHRPCFAYEYQHVTDTRLDYQGSPSVRTKTWHAVYVVDHYVSSRGGLPGTIREDHPLKQSILATDSDLAQQCRLVIIRNKYLDAIAFNGATQSGLVPPQQRLALLRLFKDEVASYLEALSPSSIISRILAHYTLLSIGGFCLAGDMQGDFDAELIPLVHAGFASATAVLELISPLMWETLPMHIIRCLVYAAIYAVQLRRSRFDSKYFDVKIDMLVERIVSILLPLSFGNDFATRSRTALEPHRHYTSRGSDDRPSPVLCQSRMGANIYWDLFHHEGGPHKWTIDRTQIWAELMDIVSR